MLSRFEKFICDITEIDLYWHRVATAVMKRYGLKGNYAIYFTRLHGCPNGITAAELAALCGKDKADVSRDISALEKAGFISRIRTGDSGYRAQITLTERGQELTGKIIRHAEQAVSCVGSDYTEEEREVFYRVLDRITSNLQTLSETGLPE